MDRADLVAERGSRQIQDLILEVGKDKMGNGGETKKVDKRTGGQAKSKETGDKGKGEICMRLDVKEGEINLSRLARQRAGKDVQQVLWTMLFAFCDL